MTTWLRQSTAVDVMLGPALDSTDGNTIEGALTITQPDIRLSKNGGTFAQKSAAQTLVHGENGWYPCNLSTTDTNTLGSLLVVVHESGALQVWREFMVVTQQVWDSLFGSDLLQVDLTQLLGSAMATPTVAGVPKVDVTHWLGTAPSAPSVAGVPKVDLSHYDGSTAPALVSSRYPAHVGAFTANSITATAFENDAITAAKIADGAIDAATFALGAINAAAIGTAAITAAKFGAGAIDASAIAAGAIDADAFVAGAVNETAIADGAINAATFATNAITATAIAADAITAAKIAANAITSSELADGAITAAKFAAGAINAAAIADGAIDDATVAADMDQYAAKVWVIKEGTTADHYAVAFYKNGQRVTSGVTSPTIQVIKGSDGTDLIASTALTEIGSTHRFKKDESTNKLVAGAIYFAVVSATIDGSSRSWDQQIGRDSA